MSADLTRREFELLLDEYVRGELPEERAEACRQYLDRDPAARRLAHQAGHFLLSPAWQAAGRPPAGLLEQAGAGVAEQLRASAGPVRRGRLRSGPARPLWAWAALTAGALVAVVLLWPSAAPLVFADVIARLQEAGSLQVEGWVLGEDRQQVPYRQWLLADGTLRAEVGPPGRERIVVRSGGERRIRDLDGRLYSLPEPRTRTGSPDDLRTSLERLQALYRNEESAAASYSFTREERGPLTRFTRRDRGPLGRGPSRREWTLDVDRDTARPVTSQVRELVGEDWIQVSELRFTQFDQAPAAGTFSLPGQALAVDDEARGRLWFELGVSPASIQVPAVVAPAGGVEVTWLEPADRPAGLTSGGAMAFDGGITVIEMHNLALRNAVMLVAGRAVAGNEAAGQPVSLRLRAKTALPWRRQLAPVLEHLGLRAEVACRRQSRQRHEFSLAGTAPAASRHEFPHASTQADTNGYHYRFEKTPLRDVITALMGNSTRPHAVGDTLVFANGRDAGPDPFATEVDVAFHNADGTWATNLAYLQERFGVAEQVHQETVDAWEITLVAAAER